MSPNQGTNQNSSRLTNSYSMNETLNRTGSDGISVRSASSAEITRRISGGLTPKSRVTPRAQDIHQKMLSNASESSSHASNESNKPKEPPSYLQHIQTHSRNQYQVQSPLSASL